MRALVYHGPGPKAGRRSRDRASPPTPTPSCGSTPSTICGTDLHILKGDVPAVTDGRILGHEAVGTVEEVGAGVKNVAVGRPGAGLVHHRVRRCRFCREGRYGQCLGGGGWILGHLIDGTQAEYVRVPFADTSTYPVAGRRQRRGAADAGRHPARPATRSACSTARSARATSSPSSAPGRSACRRSWAPGCSAPSHVVAIDLADSPARGGQAVRRRRRRQQRREDAARPSCAS